MGLAYSMTGVR